MLSLTDHSANSSRIATLLWFVPGAFGDSTKPGVDETGGGNATPDTTSGQDDPLEAAAGATTPELEDVALATSTTT